MPRLVPIQIDDNTVIYIESTQEQVDVTPPIDSTCTADEFSEPQETTRESLGKGEKGRHEDLARLAKKVAADAGAVTVESCETIGDTILSFTNFSLGALKKVGNANVDKVTLEFGVEVGGEAGVPYVTKGTATCNLKIIVECSFPK